MTAFYLVRHASTAWTGTRYCGRSDPELNAAGRASAMHLAVGLRPVVAACREVTSSPLRRAMQTAALIAPGAAVRVDDRLAEADFGDADGATFAEIERRWPALATALARGDPRVDWPGGESWVQIAERASAFCADLSRDRDLIVITHGFIGRAVLLALGRDEARQFGAGAVVEITL